MDLFRFTCLKFIRIDGFLFTRKSEREITDYFPYFLCWLSIIENNNSVDVAKFQPKKKRTEQQHGKINTRALSPAECQWIWCEPLCCFFFSECMKLAESSYNAVELLLLLLLLFTCAPHTISKLYRGNVWVCVCVWLCVSP